MDRKMLFYVFGILSLRCQSAMVNSTDCVDVGNCLGTTHIFFVK